MDNLVQRWWVIKHSGRKMGPPWRIPGQGGIETALRVFIEFFIVYQLRKVLIRINLKRINTKTG